MSGIGWTRQDAVLDAIWEALARWDEAERRAHDLRQITKAEVQRVDRLPDGTRIRTPRRNALARHLTDAALTAIREWERSAAAPAEAREEGPPEPWEVAAMIEYGDDHFDDPPDRASIHQQDTDRAAR